jgi:beta-galactosidase
MIRAACSLFFLIVSAALGAEPTRLRESFDDSWSFQRGEASGAEKPDFNASAWRALDLPHDFAVEGPFDPKNASGAPGGFLPGDIGWYRKTFRLAEGLQGRRVFIEFDGVFMNSEVWINGHHLGKRPYGFIGFEYDLTPHLSLTDENLIAVRVDNSKLPSARWYTGTGIYRHVWLKITNPVHVAHWGTYVTTPEVTQEKAVVSIQTTIRNHHDSPRSVMVKQSINSNTQSITTPLELPASGEGVVTQQLVLTDPKLWSPEAPNLYTIQTELSIDGKMVDLYETPVGVRTLRFDAQQGLFINGLSTKMKGVCNHQDLGPLGTALWDQALERRLKMLKNMGCNAIRTAHYPHSPELMTLCDKMGFLVLDETFDEWRRGWDFEGKLLVSSKNNKGKAPFGYNKYFDEWHERDLTDHLKRDRNHPCVIMWSVGNEVPESVKNGEIETVKILRDLCHKIDPTRPVTVGCNHIKSANESGFTGQLDIVGYNEGVESVFEIEGDRLRYPNRKMYLSEVPHSLQTRGEYRTHPRYYRPGFDHAKLTEKEVFPETDAYYESSYDNAGVQIDAQRSWRMTKNQPYIMGEFRWTGFDYIGESGGWPRVLGNYGIIDLCNFPKDTFYFYQSQWTDKPMVHLLPHWTWPGKEGIAIPVWCYTNCDEAELFLNSTSLGIRRFDGKNDMHLEWLVPYQPGELKVITRKDGKEVATASHETADAPARMSISADQSTLDPTKRDLSYVTIRVEDKNGRFAPKAAKWVNVQIEGPGRLVGSGGGDPLSQTTYQANTFRTFNGLGLAIIAATSGPEPEINKGSDRKPGEIIVRVQSKGMESFETRLTRTNGGQVKTSTTLQMPSVDLEVESVDGLPSAR